jgi:glycosyltransferase involved in cell wall biosynthesis
MKILHTVEVFYPPEGGMQKVVREISERLAKMGHLVTIATKYDSRIKYTTKNNIVIKQFKISGNFVRGYEGEAKEIRRYQNFLKNSYFDIITNFAAQQWATDLTFPLLTQLKAKKVFVPTGFSGLYLPEYQKYFANMKNWMKKYDMNVFLSNNYRDINFARKSKIKKIELIPNGASEEEFLLKSDINVRKELEISNNTFLILHVGSHTGLKGHKEMMSIFSQARITNTVLLVIGNKKNNGCFKSCSIRSKIFNLSPIRLIDKKKIILASLNRKKTVSVYKQADLFLFPSNIECSPIVLFECMASKTPFLTTDVGNSKEIIKWSRGGVILPTMKDKNGYGHAKINESARMLEDMYVDKKEREKISENGFKVWKKRFTWKLIAKQYDCLYRKLLKKNVL